LIYKALDKAIVVAFKEMHNFVSPLLKLRSV